MKNDTKILLQITCEQAEISTKFTYKKTSLYLLTQFILIPLFGVLLLVSLEKKIKTYSYFGHVFTLCTSCSQPEQTISQERIGGKILDTQSKDRKDMGRTGIEVVLVLNSLFLSQLKRLQTYAIKFTGPVNFDVAEIRTS